MKSFSRLFRLLFAFAIMPAPLVALTSGPAQPEYSGFTSVTQKDMVDFKSGDFAYSIPLMEVPGPSISYPLTLGYHSGIPLEEEATWVGLGWDFNAGAIQRGMNRYPDDYSLGRRRSHIEGSKTVYAHELGFSMYGISASVRWSDNEGVTGSIGFAGFNFEYNNRKGFGPNGDGVAGGIIGLGLSSFAGGQDNGADLTSDDMRWGNIEGLPGAKGIASMGQKLLTYSQAVSTSGFSVAGFGSQSITTGAMQSSSINLLVYRQTKSWIHKEEDSRLYGYLNLGKYPTEDVDDDFDNHGGSCDNQITPGFDPFPGDCSWKTEARIMEYDWGVASPIPELDEIKSTNFLFELLANHVPKNAFPKATPDYYSARAEGLTYTFHPYRQDIGDYYGQSGFEAQLSGWQTFWTSGIFSFFFDDEALKNIFDRTLGDYATQFMKEGTTQYGSQYPISLFRQMGDPGGTFMGEQWGPPCNPQALDCGDWAGALIARYRNRESGGNRHRLPLLPKTSQGVEMPDRMSGSTGIFPIFKKTYPGDDPAIPLDALIGFTVVRADGMVYEYHQPVFNWVSKEASVTRPTDAEREENYGDFDFGSFKAYNSMERPFAYAWLLTAVKAADYYDMTSGTASGPRKGDLGGWVRFEYDPSKRIRNFHWRTPYQGTLPLGTGKDQSVSSGGGNNIDFKSYGQASWGIREVRYLTGIFTPTHRAQVNTSDREDGMQAHITENDFAVGNAGSQAWVTCPFIRAEPGDKLQVSYSYLIGQIPHPFADEATVTSIEDVAPACETDANGDPQGDGDTRFSCYNGNASNRRMLVTLAAGGTFPNPSTVVGDTKRLTHKETLGAKRLQMVDNIQLFTSLDDDAVLDPGEEVVKEARFSYESVPYQMLAPGVPNSLYYQPGAAGNIGKLTLREIRLGDGQAFFPPYRFEYYKEGMEAPYYRDHWDRWGFYKSDGGLERTDIGNAHILDWAAFHSQIKTPSTFLIQDVNAALGTALGPIQSAPNLTDDMKRKVLAATNKVKDNLHYYNQRRTSINLPARSDRVKNQFTKLRTGPDPIFTNDNGVPRSVLSQKDSNEIEWLNAAIFADFHAAFLRKDRENRFDHEVNPDDVKAWSLKTVTLPSGGKLAVEYESDDYAYVGRARQVQGKFEIDGQPSHGGYFQNIGQEKGLLSASSFFNLDDQFLGSNYEQRAANIRLRVGSLFRLYRQTDNGEIQLNKDFELLRQRKNTPLPGQPAGENKLHLIAWYTPPSALSFVTAEENLKYPNTQCGEVEVSSTQGSTNLMQVEIPIDLGVVALDFDYHSGAIGSWPKEKFCQWNYVDFNLNQLMSAYFQAREPSKCAIQDFLAGKFRFQWARKRNNFSDLPQDEWAFRSNTMGADEITVNGRNDNCNAGPCRWSYVDIQNPPARLGYMAWVGLEEFGTGTVDIAGAPSAPFENKYWDLYSYSVFLHRDAPTVGKALGVPGGGIRVKRLTLSTEWVHKRKSPNQFQTVEYAYDGAGGFGGAYSSGSTPSVPPPYSNKGDDRPTLPPDLSLVSGAPGVKYRTVAEIRPGLGRTVYNFLGAADVSDFYEDQACNYDGLDCYETAGPGIFFSAHHRWKLNRMSQFQGVMRSILKYDESGRMVASTKMTYQTSMSQPEINQVREIALMNNSDGTAVEETLVPTVSVQVGGQTQASVKINAGYSGYATADQANAFQNHEAADHLGKTVTRYRHRWNYTHDVGCQDGAFWCIANGYDGETDPRSAIGLTDVEEVEHSLKEYQVVNTQMGVGTKSTHAYFDFHTGKPLLTLTEPLLPDPENPVATKSSLEVPAYWIADYSPEPSGNTQALSMGPVYRDPKFRDVYLGNAPFTDLKTRNMLQQPFSTSLYANLGAFENTSAWRDKLRDIRTGTNSNALFNRSFTTWKPFGSSGVQAWRLDEEMALRLPMNSQQRLVPGQLTIGYPYLPKGQTAANYFQGNPVYVLKSRNTQYDSFGNVLESQDAYGNYLTKFFQQGKYKVGEVLHANRNSCAVMVVDEIVAGAVPAGWSLGGATVSSDFAHSGTKSLLLPAGQPITLGLSNPAPGKDYELSFWMRATAENQVLVTLGGINRFASFNPIGAEWQRVVMPVTLSQTATHLGGVIACASGSVHLDDFRIAPQEAQVFTMTYDGRGQMTSMSNPNDIIRYFDYDALDRLTGIRDEQKVFVSEQTQLDAK